MLLAGVMQLLADQAATIDGLRCFGFPADSVVPPALMVGFPESYDFDEAYERGMDKVVLPLWLVVPRTVDRTTRDLLAAYCDGSGETSIKAVLEAGTYPGLTVNVDAVEFDFNVSIAAIGMPAAKFTVSVWGEGE